MNHRALPVLAMLAGVAMASASPGEDGEGDDIQASTATLTVDDDRVQCPGAQYTNIQAAVAAAHCGDKINVCPGTYHEQVEITKPLTIRGVAAANQNQAVVMPSPALQNTTSASGAPLAAIILVENTSDVKLINLTIDGAASDISDPELTVVGIFYQNASGRIDHTAIRNIGRGEESGVFINGIGIAVENARGRLPPTEILNNSVHDYQSIGIVADGPGADITIKGNAVSGPGPISGISPVGIFLLDGAYGTIANNSIINHFYTLCISIEDCDPVANAGANILLDQTGDVEVAGNTVGKSQASIVLAGDRARIHNNRVLDTDVLYGIAVMGERNHVNNNAIFNSHRAAIFVNGSGNRITRNAINEALTGILVSAPDNQLSENRFYNTETNVGQTPLMGSTHKASTGHRPSKGHLMLRRGGSAHSP